MRKFTAENSKQMGAEVIKLDEYPLPSQRFKVPLRSEVAKFIRDRMGWPEDFCNDYAEDFWMYYQAQGWKLSNGVQMKDWKAAFLRQWKEPKGKRAEQLAEMQKKENVENPLVYLNECLDLHSKGQYKPGKPEVLSIYDYLKATGRITRQTFTNEEWDKLVADAGNSKERGRMLTVKRLFDKMVKHNEQFK
jgi:hypothetical protein